jgi:hypothetical protein
VLPKIQSNTIAEHRAEITGFPLHRDARASATANARNSHTELVQIIDIYYKLLIYLQKSDGTAGHRTLSLSTCFHGYLVLRFLKMPPLVPPRSVGCYRKSLEIKSA